MVNEVTTTADIIDPIVWADAVGPKILQKAVLAPYVTVDDTLVGQPGSTVEIPKWDYIGDAADLTEGVEMETDKLTITTTKATVKEAGKALSLTDTALLYALGDPNGQVLGQLATSISRKIDTDIQSAALYTHTNGGAGDEEPTSAPLTFQANGPLSWGAYVDSIALLGDEYDPNELAALVVHSKQYVQLLKDQAFLTVDKMGLDRAAMRSGVVGQLGTVPVIMSDRMTAITDAHSVTAGNQAGHNALLLKRGAITLRYKRRPIVERDRNILSRVNVITTNVHYGVKRSDDRGVIVLKLTD